MELLGRKFAANAVQTASMILLLAAAASALKSGSPTAAVATINLRGIVGTVRFIAVGENSTNVTANFSGLPPSPSGGLNWHVHRFPTDLTLAPTSRCLNDNVGGHYDPFGVRSNPNYTTDCNTTAQSECEVGDLTGKFGQLRNGFASYTDNTGLLNLGGRLGIVGRSIVVHGPDGANFVCATIRSQSEVEGADVVTLSATFIAPLAGTIYIRQVANEDAIMFGKLFWVTTRGQTLNHNWHIHELKPSPYYRNGQCTDVGPHFDPFNRPPPSSDDYFCTPEKENITNCEVGDLTGKHDQINVAGNPQPYQADAFFYTDIFLSLTGVNAVEDRSIAIHAPNGGVPIIACAPLVRAENRYVSQFSSGYFQASQASPYDLTSVTVNNLPSPNLNILTDVLTTYNLCPASSSRSLYTPFPLDTQPGETMDSFPVGALYQKHPTELRRAGSFRATEQPIYGVNTITSRTLRITTGDRRSCSALTPPYNMNTTIVAVASFNDSVLDGHVIFIQEVYPNGRLGLTNMITDLRYADSSMMTTAGHSWHIHQRAPTVGLECQGNIGPHFNPFEVSLNDSNGISNYSTDCSPYSPLRCESGDLTGKHGQITISPPGADQPTYTNIDPSLYLYGPENHTIIGRSVGIHRNMPGGPLFSCAEVRRSYLSPVMLTIQEPSDFNRLGFTSNIARGAQQSPLSLLLMHTDVGTPSNSRQTNCVEFAFNVIGDTGSESAQRAATVQSSVCRRYYNDPCMTNREDFSTLCPNNGALNSASVSVVTIAVLFLVSLFIYH